MTLPLVVLERLETSEQGTFGRIYVRPPSLILFAGELPDRGNARNRSRVPAGAYRVVWTWSPAFRRFMYLLEDVPSRSGIRIHPANLMGDVGRGYRSQLNGCIALGERIGWLDGQKALLASAPAVRRLEDALDRRPFELHILDEGGEPWTG